jgi:hypothetical protein
LRAGSGPNGTEIHIQVVDSEPPSAAAHPIQRAQSAEWIEPAAQSAADSHVRSRSQGGTMPVSAVVAMPHDELHDALKSVDVLDLMRRLRTDDGDRPAEARRELLRRGFNEVDLQLARQLFSPDAEDRKQLAREVPRLSSVDAAQWLMWLALDPQAEVRLAAVTTLATTGDPGLLDRVEALARNDRDPQVHALAAQIAKQRELAAGRGDSTGSAGHAAPLR